MDSDSIDFTKACNELELKYPFSEKMLKKQYHLMALKYHPDKYDKDNGEKFKKINNAYLYLNKDLNKKNNKTSCYVSENYEDLLKEFLQYNDITIDISLVISIIDMLSNNYDVIAKNLFIGLGKNNCFDVFKFLNKYKDILNIKSNLLDKLNEIVLNKYKDDNHKLIILNPTMDDLFQSNISKIEFDNDIYYMPLWHSEVTYKTITSEIIVKCIPKCPDYIYIDEVNNIHVHLNIKFTKNLLQKSYISFNIESRECKIQMQELKIAQKQTIKKCKKGIPIINTNDIYDNNNLSDLFIHIEFS